MKSSGEGQPSVGEISDTRISASAAVIDAMREGLGPNAEPTKQPACYRRASGEATRLELVVGRVDDELAADRALARIAHGVYVLARAGTRRVRACTRASGADTRDRIGPDLR